MRRVNKKILIVTTIVCLLPILVGLIFYNSLPEKIAVHFNINNQPDNYFTKAGFVWGMPIIMLVLQIFCCVVSDLSNKNPEANKKVITIYKWIIPILTIVLYGVTIGYALGKEMDIRKIVMCIIGILFIVMGNYIPKVIGNNRIANLKDERLKRRLTRLMAYLFITNGILAILSIVFDSMVSVAVIGIAILEVILVTIYAYTKSRKEYNDVRN